MNSIVHIFSKKLAGWLVLLLFIEIFLVPVKPSVSRAAHFILQTGDTAPPVNFIGLNGKQYSEAAVKGAKSTLLCFWSSWSGRSLQQMQDLKRLHTNYSAEGLTILAINVEAVEINAQEKYRLEELTKELGLPFIVGIDQKLETFSRYGKVVSPSTVLVKEDGTVLYTISGYPASAPLDIEEAVQKALGIFVEKKKPSYAQEGGYKPVKKAQLRYGLARRLAQKGFEYKSIIEFHEAAAADENFPDPWLYLTFINIHTGNFKEARQAFDQARKLAPNRPETTLLQALLALSAKDIDNAVKILQETDITVLPSSEVEVALTMKEQGQTEQATTALTASIHAAVKSLGLQIHVKRDTGASKKMQQRLEERQKK